jgi:hypothetical protein
VNQSVLSDTYGINTILSVIILFFPFWLVLTHGIVPGTWSRSFLIKALVRFLTIQNAVLTFSCFSCLFRGFKILHFFTLGSLKLGGVIKDGIAVYEYRSEKYCFAFVSF